MSTDMKVLRLAPADSNNQAIHEDLKRFAENCAESGQRVRALIRMAYDDIHPHQVAPRVGTANTILNSDQLFIRLLSMS